jgi:hypothetical protein
MKETPVQKVARHIAEFDYETVRALQVVGDRLAWRGLTRDEIFAIWDFGFVATMEMRADVRAKIDSLPTKTPNVRGKLAPTAGHQAQAT